MDLFCAVLCLCMSLFLFLWGAVKTLRIVGLKRNGRRAVANLTKIRRERWARGETFYAVATWKDEYGRKRIGNITSYGDYLLRHINKPLVTDEIYYNERHVMLVKDKGTRFGAVVSLVFGSVCIALGVWIFFLTHSGAA